VARDVLAGKVSAAAADIVYGVVLDGAGVVDADATARERAARRQARTGWQPLPVDADQPITEATGGAARSVHEYVIETDAEGRRVLACAGCGHVLSDYRGRFKRGLVTTDTELGSLPGFIDPAIMLDDHVVLRQYACPGCGVLIASEVAKADEEPFDEMVLS
jgi:N-methylhydantoinase B